MIKAIVLVFAMFGQMVWAYPCPQQSEDTQLQSELLQAWLGLVRNQARVGTCEIEITLCDPTLPAATGGPIGEIYIRDTESKREAYLPLTLITPGFAKGKTRLSLSERRLSYLKYDYLFENEFGRTEAYRLDMRLTEDQSRIRKIDLGTYSTNKKLRGPGGNRSRWYNCVEP